MSHRKFRLLFCGGLVAITALAGCASTQTAAPVDSRTAVRTENVPALAGTAQASTTQANTNSRSESQGGSQSTKPDTNASNASSQSRSSNSEAQNEARSDSTNQSSSESADRATQSAGKRTAESTKDPAPLRKPRTASKPYREGDWRPEFHTVRKGDTLYSVALDFGRDYRDLARWNSLADPSYIQIGQQLRLFPSAGSSESRGDVLTTGTTAKPVGKPENVPTFSDPKAHRALYSEQAYAELTRVLSGETQTTVVKAAPATTTVAKKTAQAPKPVAAGPSAPAQKAMPTGRPSWEWPAPGKVVYKFAGGPNKKGIAIEGTPGQAIVSSAPGKVVYSGSGLRGYGNLIIIKHNDTYLSVYAHNSQLLVREGQMVAQGQRIAVMGKALGNVTALHFEIRRLGKPIDPLGQLPARPS